MSLKGSRILLAHTPTVKRHKPEWDHRIMRSSDVVAGLSLP
jgi:hypothetical protein